MTRYSLMRLTRTQSSPSTSVLMMIPKQQALARTIINHLYEYNMSLSTIFTSDCIKNEARYYGKKEFLFFFSFFFKWIVPKQMSFINMCRIYISHYSLDILITYCHMTHTYRALGVGTLNGNRRAVCSFSLPSGASAHFSILSCT